MLVSGKIPWILLKTNRIFEKSLNLFFSSYILKEQLMVNEMVIENYEFQILNYYAILILGKGLVSRLDLLSNQLEIPAWSMIDGYLIYCQTTETRQHDTTFAKTNTRCSITNFRKSFGVICFTNNVPILQIPGFRFATFVFKRSM